MDTGFFKWLWRFNAVALAALMALGCGMLLWTAILSDVFSKGVQDRQVVITEDETTAADAKEEQFLDVRGFIQGPDVYDVGLYKGAIARREMAPVGALSYESSIGKAKRPSTLVNLGHMNQAGETVWMFEDNLQFIADVQQLTAPSEERRMPRPPIARLLQVVTTDTTGDNTLSMQDTRTIFLTKLDSLALSEVMSGVEALRVLSGQPKGWIALQVKIAGQYKIVEIDMTTFRVIREIPQPDMK